MENCNEKLRPLHAAAESHSSLLIYFPQRRQVVVFLSLPAYAAWTWRVFTRVQQPLSILLENMKLHFTAGLMKTATMSSADRDGGWQGDEGPDLPSLGPPPDTIDLQVEFTSRTSTSSSSSNLKFFGLNLLSPPISVLRRGAVELKSIGGSCRSLSQHR